MRAVIATGSGRYADPWHPYPKTSAALRDVLADDFDVTVDTDVDRVLARLADVGLLVVNAGDPWQGDAASAGVPRESLAGLRQALERGIGVLAMHSAVATLRDHPEWAAATGGIWVPGGSFHPPAGVTRIEIADEPEVAGVSDFEVFDERYCRLQRVGDSRVVAWHGGDGAPEPAVWVREHRGARVAVDVLGHDARSYESPGHRDLVRALARWAARV